MVRKGWGVIRYGELGQGRVDFSRVEWGLREKRRGLSPSPFPSRTPLVADPARRPPAFLIFPTNREPETG